MKDGRIIQQLTLRLILRILIYKNLDKILSYIKVDTTGADGRKVGDQNLP